VLSPDSSVGVPTSDQQAEDITQDVFVDVAAAVALGP
jgi:hypothetical protein